jgi:ABC-type glycerol-3-phosphate transport system permease component
LKSVYNFRALPPIVLVIPFHVMAQATGTRDTVAVMILVCTASNIPVAVWLLLPVIGVRATEQEEAAQLDGASHFGIFFTVLLPMVRVSDATARLLIFLLC